MIAKMSMSVILKYPEYQLIKSVLHDALTILTKKGAKCL